jgi:hypothetical protein
MDITYKMIGSDGQQYGPITLEQIKDWVREGRVTAATQVLRSDINSWLPASQYTELALAQSLPMPTGAPTPFSVNNPATAVAIANLERRVKSAAGWFFFIGAFSLINSIVLMSGKGIRFVVGLGVTDIISIFASRLENAGMIIGLALDLLVLGVFVFFGIFARKGHSWSFIAGMLCYAADAGLFLLLRMEMISVLFHGLVIFFIFSGLQANIKLKAFRRGAVA